MGHLTALIILDITYFLIFIMPIFEYKNVLVTGNVSENLLFLSSINPEASSISLIIFAISAIIYLIIGIITKYKTDLNTPTMKKLYRSLSLIVFLNLGLLLIYYILSKIIAGHSLKNYKIITVNAWFIVSYFGNVYLIGQAANVPILFINSSDYRNAYLKEFNLIKTFFKKIFNNSPTTISVIPKVININKITPISS
uniref:Serpentine receptor class gamma n=1 Tax=Meloidogyne floridensis TaxID=298350 RepID=A0A915PB83_9BILA